MDVWGMGEAVICSLSVNLKCLNKKLDSQLYINTCETVQIVLLPFNYTKNARYMFSLYTLIYK